MNVYNTRLYLELMLFAIFKVLFPINIFIDFNLPKYISIYTPYKLFFQIFLKNNFSIN